LPEKASIGAAEEARIKNEIIFGLETQRRERGEE